MFRTLRDAFKIPDLRKKIIYTMLMFFAIRIGAHIRIPLIDPTAVQNMFKNADDAGLFGMFDAFSGGAFKDMTLFAMGITPYITSSIIMNLLTIAIPKLEEMQKEGEEGRKKIAKITRYGTIVLALLQSVAISIGLGRSLFYDYNLISVIIAVTAMTAGTAFLMWVGEQITVKGVGNGISLIIFINIISRLPFGTKKLYTLATASKKLIPVIILLIIYVLMVTFVVLIQLGERRIPVQYAKRMQGRKVYGGQSTHIPLKVNMAGVIPVIFASSLLQFPGTVTQFFGKPDGWWASVIDFLKITSISGALIYFVFILFFAYFYTSIIFNPIEVANNMKKNGGFVPGIRPGKPTVDYLSNVLNKIVLIGALALALIALLPVILSNMFSMNVTFGGTSLIIVVGVALETIKQIESQMVMRHYKGFLNA
ncbi:preprotein translocase subunit SecY [Vallitalea sp.]|jgi:preprotein translocase subunit SecY|uniref:preprotein translocase subunit SecY n=1 Tax=Vallitalea sp. TaxID=1882829 RepID=UPI0025D9AAD9|nr:preprotein translocase subunit SecY [Vallitalea sp.]MCT4686295.1 preprotein translocase subunit SecY [Vallitalea sp.]